MQDNCFCFCFYFCSCSFGFAFGHRTTTKSTWRALSGLYLCLLDSDSGIISQSRPPGLSKAVSGYALQDEWCFDAFHLCLHHSFLHSGWSIYSCIQYMGRLSIGYRNAKRAGQGINPKSMDPSFLSTVDLTSIVLQTITASLLACYHHSSFKDRKAHTVVYHHQYESSSLTFGSDTFVLAFCHSSASVA